MAVGAGWGRDVDECCVTVDASASASMCFDLHAWTFGTHFGLFSSVITWQDASNDLLRH